jgi:hypothetical protein
MTALARKRGVSAVEGEISHTVIELLTAELDDVRITPQVLGMTRMALGGFDSRQTAVKAAVLGDIRGDLVVTGEAQLSLPPAIGTVVALRAVLFEFLVGAGQLPGHEQRLGIYGLGQPRRYAGQEHCHHQ